MIPETAETAPPGRRVPRQALVRFAILVVVAVPLSLLTPQIKRTMGRAEA